MNCSWSYGRWGSQALCGCGSRSAIEQKHFVSIDGAMSSLLPVYSGVPQGSILGPLLFLVYVNDIPTTICYSTAYLFADDTKFVDNNLDELQIDINSLQSWCEKWVMSLHPDKCTVVRYGLSTQVDPEYSLDGVSS